MIGLPSVRPAIPSDLPALVAAAEVFATTQRAFAPNDVPAPFDPELASVLFVKAICGDGGFLSVAPLGQGSVGYALWTLIDQPLSILSRPGKILFVTQIAVPSASRRRGVGSAIVEHLKGIGTELGATSFALDVSMANTAAVQFFRHSMMKPASIIMQMDLPRSSRR